jgi:hypothetical protein
MNTWETIIGDERERDLLDTVMDVALDLKQADGCLSSVTFEWLCDYIAGCWREGNLAEAGFTLDDLAGLSWRLGQLTPEQREQMLAKYLEPWS